jgi:nucleotide-binding universal stress UspA family protein
MDLPLIEKQVVDMYRKRLTDVGEVEAPGARVEPVVRVGKVVPEVVTAAKSTGTDLIVISTHGCSRAEGTLLGSTTERVVRHAPCPVLVVREKEREFLRKED